MTLATAPPMILLIFLPVATFAQVKNGAAGDSTNLALSATVTTSFVSAWETLASVKDGFEPSVLVRWG